MNDAFEVCDARQKQLFDEVRSELQRIKKSGSLARVVAFTENLDAPNEFILAINVSEAGKATGIREVVRVGSYWLVPEILERLKKIDPAPHFYNLSQLLFALQEFNPDLSEWDYR